jgi:hypothetical protein
MQRLPDRGLSKGLASYCERVHEIAYEGHPAVLIELRDPASCLVLNDGSSWLNRGR